MSSESDARRIAKGSPPSQLVGEQNADQPESLSQPLSPPQGPSPFDPLNLCIFATIALLGWLAGPVAVIVFSAIGFIGYAKARQAGLKRSKCYLHDTRLVLAYLGILTVAGLWGTYMLAAHFGGF
ncbi:hypothetical protein [Arthrobacter sp. FW306-04-A]|uniref:hypothetical protein n=1 Tax=Arthrobacter sp. FW306-04-A TaxID=2879619 RepID=UPI0037C0C360|nr:hypothetical protein LFT43_08930 [Arthrobacter sp. FW306-04-A]